MNKPESASEDAQAYQVDDMYIRITNKPMSCCGVIQQGWEGKVAYILDVADHLHSNIIILEDGTLVWEHHCEIIDTPRKQ